MAALELTRAPRILAIDPGPVQSGWLLWDGPHQRPLRFGISPNEELVGSLRSQLRSGDQHGAPDVVAIELIEPRYGIQMGWSTLDTARWVGRFQEAARPVRVALLKRSEILRHLGVVTSPRKGEKRVSADSGVRQALLDRFGGTKAKGTKAAPGPLYGMTADMYSALAIAVTFAETGRMA